MYKRISLVALFIGGMIFTSSAQCDNCEKDKDENTFCYQNDKFENYCATFKEGSATVDLQKGKKTKSIPLTAASSLEDLIKIGSNKKLKISAVDILFLQSGLEVWKIESRKLGHEYTDSGLGIKTIQKGSGALPEKGQRVKVHYTGFLENGKKFDSSVDRGEPFTFTLGAGRVIKGWDEGVQKLNIGTKALLKIPSELGYGARGSRGAIPPNATLYFEIEVLGVE